MQHSIPPQEQSTPPHKPDNYSLIFSLFHLWFLFLPIVIMPQATLCDILSQSTISLIEKECCVVQNELLNTLPCPEREEVLALSGYLNILFVEYNATTSTVL